MPPLFWCGQQDSNLHARALEPKSNESTNSTMPAYGCIVTPKCGIVKFQFVEMPQYSSVGRGYDPADAVSIWTRLVFAQTIVHSKNNQPLRFRNLGGGVITPPYSMVVSICPTSCNLWRKNAAREGGVLVN